MTEISPESKKTMAESKDEKKKEYTAKERAESLLSSTRHGQRVAQLFGEALDKQYLIHGKPMQEWRRQFKVKIPENPDPSQCKAIAAKLANLFHEATFYYSLSEAQLSALAAGDFKEYTAAYTQAIADFKAKNPKRALPAAKTLENIANQQVVDIKAAMSNAQIAKNFWKRILEGLTEVRKNLEIVSKSLYFELQIEKNYSNPVIVGTPNRGSYGDK